MTDERQREREREREEGRENERRKRGKEAHCLCASGQITVNRTFNKSTAIRAANSLLYPIIKRSALFRIFNRVNFSAGIIWTLNHKSSKFLSRLYSSVTDNYVLIGVLARHSHQGIRSIEANTRFQICWRKSACLSSRVNTDYHVAMQGYNGGGGLTEARTLLTALLPN